MNALRWLLVSLLGAAAGSVTLGVAGVAVFFAVAPEAGGHNFGGVERLLTYAGRGLSAGAALGLIAALALLTARRRK